MLKTSQGTSEDNGVPHCYGQKFDANEPACVGGHDPTYWNGENRIRENCTWVPSCSVKTQAQSQSQLIPASSLVRPPQNAYTKFIPPAAPQPWRPPAQPYAHTPSHQQQQPQHWGNANYGIPQYLSVREPATGRGIVARLCLEVLRSLGKSFGHTIAHFFDFEAIGPRPPQLPPPQEDTRRPPMG